MKKISDYGTWKSLITPSFVTEGVKKFNDIVIDNDNLYWHETRPYEAGRGVIVCCDENNNIKDITPSLSKNKPKFNVRTKVQEYGGSAFTVSNGVIYFVNYSDQKIYVQNKNDSQPKPLTKEGIFYADLQFTKYGIIAIGEERIKDKEAENFIALINLETGECTKIITGNDFYAYPTISPDQTKLAWITWNHPNMPWDNTELWEAEIDNNGLPIKAKKIAGNNNESIVEPLYRSDNTLFFVSDRDNWWNIYQCANLSDSFNSTNIFNSRNTCDALNSTNIPDISDIPNSTNSLNFRENDNLRDNDNLKKNDNLKDNLKDNFIKVCPQEAEFSSPMWIHGIRSYGFSKDLIIASYNKEGIWSLCVIDTKTYETSKIVIEGCNFNQIKVVDSFAVFIRSYSDKHPDIVKLSFDQAVIIDNSLNDLYYTQTKATEATEATGKPKELEELAESIKLAKTATIVKTTKKGAKTIETAEKKSLENDGINNLTNAQANSLENADLIEFLQTIIVSSSSKNIESGYISIPQRIKYKSADARDAYALYYPPKNKDYEGLENTLPPLIVKIHGGPTASAVASFDSRLQFWTSRGFGVVDVNYGGSSGFGRNYRNLLKGNWGIIDVEDCEYAAKYLISKNLVDKNKIAIRGGSAGGFTTLAALIFKDIFSVGGVYYGVSDLIALTKDTHKFESRYLDTLIGVYPRDKKIYDMRSPINHVQELKVPVIFFQGDEDEVVPLNQATTMYNALKQQGIKSKLIIYEKEQHGFSKAENIQDSLQKELEFYLSVFFDV